jgi:acyl-homoserine lactone acylase PvdQ
MDGSRGTCHPAADHSSPQPGLLPARARPRLTRTDFVANSNGSYWLTNAAAPLEGFSPVIGKERTPQSLRTRQGQVQVADRLQGKDGLPGNRMSRTDLEQILFSGRSLQAELVVPSLLEACKQRSSIEPAAPSGTPPTSSATAVAPPTASSGTSAPMPTTRLTASSAQSHNAQPSAPADSTSPPRSGASTDSSTRSVASTSVSADSDSSARITRGCLALAAWNLHYDLASTGSQVFTEFVRQLRQHGEDLGTNPGIWHIPFNAADPVDTPRDFDANNPTVFKALSAAVERLDKAGIALDAKLGDIQFATRKGVHIPLHGGATYSAIHATLTPNVGYTDPMQPSNSYIQVVTFDPTGPVADAILASSQTPDPASPYFDDQTWAYSRKEWTRLPFMPAAIKAATIAPPTELRVPPP